MEREIHSGIDHGLLLLIGVGEDDTEEQAEFLAGKVLNLRVFEDDDGRMNLSALDTGARLMVISQFTLLADCSRGRRPSFTGAAPPKIAEPLYNHFAARLAESGLEVSTGVFGAMMDVTFTNVGPVTIIIDA